MKEFVSRHVTLHGCVLDLTEHPETLAFCQVSPDACGDQNNENGIESSDYFPYLEQEINLHNGNYQKQRKEFEKHDDQFQGYLNYYYCLWLWLLFICGDNY